MNGASQPARFLPRMAWAAALALLITGCATQPDLAWSPSPAQARLVELMGERLALARDVAWYKYQEGLPIRDGRREKTSLRALTARGRSMGMSSWTTGRFFRAQMAASRRLQKDMIEAWSTGTPPPGVPPADLAGVIRPRIDEINNEILIRLVGAGPFSRGRELAERAETYLLALGFPQHVVAQAIAPLH
jgi:chorismate mutase